MAKVVLIGDFSLNQFYHGRVSQVARDAPVPIVSVSKTERLQGSAGIVTEVLSKLGTRPVPIGLVGDDDAGRWIRNSLLNSRVPVDNIIVDKKVKTNTTSRVIANSVQVARFDEIAHTHLDKRNEERLFGIIERQFKMADTVIVCDYDFGLLTENITKKIIEESEKRGIDLFVSSTGTNYLRYKNSNAMIKINAENSLLLIKERDASLSSQHILERLEETLHIEKILLTRSHEGIAVYENGIVIEMPATQSKVLDIKGIGEVMIAMIAHSLLSKKNFIESCKLGNIAAGVAASVGNVQSISKNEIMKAKKEYDEWLEQK